MSEEKDPAQSEQISATPPGSQPNAAASSQDGAEQGGPAQSEQISSEASSSTVPRPSAASDITSRPTEDSPAQGSKQAKPASTPEPVFKRSLGRLIVGWVLILLVFLVLTNVFSFLATAATGMEFGGLVAAVFVFIIFAMLDQNLWLSKLFGINTGPDSSPLHSVLYFLTFGWLAFLFVRRSPASLRAAPAGGTATEPRPPQPQPKHHDVVREVAETVVFVVVLVLLLKTFIAEAFVIPTGSMATTLWGYQKVVTCPDCGYTFPVNSSSEADPQNPSEATPVLGCICPNCRATLEFTDEQEGTWDALEVDQGGEPWKFVVRYEKRPQPVFDRYQIIAKQETKKGLVVPATTVLVDGQPASAATIRRGTPVRVYYNRATHDAIVLEASSTGKFGPGHTLFNPGWNSGDRVLVAKFLYDSGLRRPERYDVVVFKYPGQLKRGDRFGDTYHWEVADGPQKNQVAMNYIKRLIGLPGETIGIHGGRLYVATGFEYNDSHVPQELRRRFTHSPDDDDDTKENREQSAKVLEIFKKDLEKAASDPTRKFQIMRKPPDVLLALARPVYDNDFQARDQQMPRWYVPQQGWTADNAEFPKRFTAAAAGTGVNWLRYRNVLRDSDKPVQITDFMGYNTGNGKRSGENWVGDLLLETEVQLDKAAKGDELRLELSRGVDRFEARCDLETGNCTLVRLTKPDNKEQVLAQKETSLKAPGTYKIRLANVDQRLTLWVNDQLPFGDGQVYDPPKTEGSDPDQDPKTNNDLNPAGIAVKGAPGLSVSHLKLGRDTYYTTNVIGDKAHTIMYVQPGHYLCLGDNSPESSDGRVWGLVPDRLLLGRALMVYFPFKPFGTENRVGPIK
jgi:signal peptidase I